MADNFLATYAPLANDIAGRTGMDPSVVLGIIDTETGGGKHVLGNNIFGITPPGGVARYPDVQTAANAFITLMQTPRYRGVAAAGDPASQALALVKGGYNTVNPQYASIVANKALSIGKQLGYQDKSGGGTEEGPAVYSTSSQPAATTDQPPTPSGSDTFFPSGVPQQPAQSPATTGSAKDRVLADPALGGNSSTAAAGGSAKDRVLADPALKTTETTTTTQETAAGKGGIARNIAAGTLEGEAGVMNVLSDPSGNLMRMPLTAGAFLYDLGAEATGLYSPLTPEQRADLLSDDYMPQPGTRTINAIGDVVGAKPSDVTATTPGERMARAGSAGVAASPLIPGGVLAPVIGGTAAVAGEEAARKVPDWAKPGTELAVNLLTGLAVPFGAAGVKAGLGATGRAVNAYVNAPGEGLIPGRSQPPPIPPETAANLLSPEARARAAETPSAGPTTPTGIEPPPSPSGGAAGAQVTPGYEAIHTPAEEAAYRATAEGKKLLEPQKIGEQDLNQYIPGETVNNAEREQTAKTARELKELGIRVPEAKQLDLEAAESNNTARTIYAENTAKSPNDIHNRTVERETDINTDKAKVFAPDNVKGDVDLAPVTAGMEKVLNDPFNRQNSALKAVYAPLLERIKNANITDPMEAWSLRRDIDKMTSARMKADNPYLHEVAHDLDGVASMIDTQIEKAAPGYNDMLATYKEHSRAITEMTALQGALKNLRGTGQKLTYNDFQRFMRDVVKGRMSPPTDLNAFKAISEANMQRLWNIRDSLRRTASAKELAMAAGSDTMPNIIDALKAVGKMGGIGALHAYVGSHLGPGGNLALQSLGAIGKTLNDRRMIRRATQQMQNLLRPSAPLRVPPGQENALTGAPPPP